MAAAVGSLIRRSTLSTGELRGVLGGLALAFVEIGRHGNDRAVELVVEGVFGAVAQRRQDLVR